MTTMDGMKSAHFWYRPVAERCGNIDVVEHVWEYGGQEHLIPVRLSWASPVLCVNYDYAT